MIRLGLALDKQSFLYELGEIKILVSHPGNVRLSSSSEQVAVRVGEPLAWQVIYFMYHPYIPPYNRVLCGFPLVYWEPFPTSDPALLSPAPSTEDSPPPPPPHFPSPISPSPWQHAGRLFPLKLTFPPPVYFPWGDLRSLGR